MCIDYEYLIKRISLFFSFMWYFTLSILPCWQQIFPFYFTSWSASVKNIVTIYNLPVNNLTAGLPASERAQLLPAMKISFMGLPGGKDTFQLEFSQHKALSVSKSCSKAVWEKITQQVCGDAVKITRECRNFPPATGPVWELAARAWQSIPSTALSLLVAGKLRQAWGWGIWAPDRSPRNASIISIRGSCLAQLGKGMAGFSHRSILCRPGWCQAALPRCHGDGRDLSTPLSLIVTNGTYYISTNFIWSLSDEDT